MNDKIERLFKVLEDEFGYFESIDEFIMLYNKRQNHTSLDIKNG